jgi:hypothetical protein
MTEQDNQPSESDIQSDCPRYSMSDAASTRLNQDDVRLAVLRHVEYAEEGTPSWFSAVRDRDGNHVLVVSSPEDREPYVLVPEDL